MLATTTYVLLLHTRNLHGLAVSAFGPADSFVFAHFERYCASLNCHVLEVVITALLYSFWLMVGLTALDVLMLAVRALLFNRR
jgi:hypothetical protein